MGAVDTVVIISTFGGILYNLFILLFGVPFFFFFFGFIFFDFFVIRGSGLKP